MINTVSHAFIATSMTDKMMNNLAGKHATSKEKAIQWILENKRPGIMENRCRNTKEVVAVIAFLCSQHASYVTESNYRVDGGSLRTAFG